MSIAAAAALACATPYGDGRNELALLDAYARRSVQIIALAAAKDEPALEALVAPDAQFSLGSGDLVNIMGKGPAGAIAMAGEIGPSKYSFHVTLVMPGPSDPCAIQEVEVEFISANSKTSAPIKFKYQNGLLSEARGWWARYTSGTVEVAR